jgi:hypothetical protein
VEAGVLGVGRLRGKRSLGFSMMMRWREVGIVREMGEGEVGRREEAGVVVGDKFGDFEIGESGGR